MTKNLENLQNSLQSIAYHIANIAQELEDAGLTSADLDNASSFCLDAAKGIKNSLPVINSQKKYLFTITLLDHSIEQTEAYCDCPIDWVVSNYHHDDMLDWSWIEIVGGEQ